MALRLVTKLPVTAEASSFLTQRNITFFTTKSEIIADIPDIPGEDLVDELNVFKAHKRLRINAEEEGGGSILKAIVICEENGSKIKPYRKSNNTCGQHAYFSCKSLVTVVLERADKDEFPVLTVTKCTIDYGNYSIVRQKVFSGATNIYKKSVSGGKFLSKQYYPAAIAAINKFLDDKCMQAYYIFTDIKQ